MDQEEKDLLKALFGWEWKETKKLIVKDPKRRPKPYFYWDGKSEEDLNRGSIPYNGRDESECPYEPHWSMMWHRDEERWTKW